MAGGRRWTVHDRDGNPVYLSQERWSHIVGSGNHPELEDFEEHLKTTIRQGRRRQEPLNPQKYRYVMAFDDLPDDSNHVVAIILFGLDVDNQGRTMSNNYGATAFFKHIRPQGERV
jgi:hypothetical protein